MNLEKEKIEDINAPIEKKLEDTTPLVKYVTVRKDKFVFIPSLFLKRNYMLVFRSHSHSHGGTFTFTPTT